MEGSFTEWTKSYLVYQIKHDCSILQMLQISYYIRGARLRNIMQVAAFRAWIHNPFDQHLEGRKLVIGLAFAGNFSQAVWYATFLTCVSVYMFMCVSYYLYAYVLTHRQPYPYLHVRINTCMYLMLMCIYVSTHIFINICIYTYIYT